jgi:hypothetical protein
MANMLEEYNTEEQRSVVRLMWAEGRYAKDIQKEMFPVYGGKSLSRKAISQLDGNRFVDDEEVKPEVRKWLRHQSKTSMLRVSTHC